MCRRYQRAGRVAVLCAFFGLAGAASGAVLFSDDSPTVGSSTSLPLGNWDGIRHSGNSGTAAVRDGISTVEATDPGTNSSRLFIGMPSGVSWQGQGMLFTPQAAFDSAVTIAQTIQSYQSNSWSFTYWTRHDASGNFNDRLAIKVDSQWYVRNAASTLVAGPVNNWIKREVLNPFGSTGWTPISFTAASALDRLDPLNPFTGTSTLPSTGTLNGVALWASNNTNFGLRLDVFEISATEVPEPAASLALIGAGALVLRRRRATA